MGNKEKPDITEIYERMSTEDLIEATTIHYSDYEPENLEKMKEILSRRKVDPKQTADSKTVSSQDIPNYLVQSILVTLFCCIPLGIVAIVNAAQVNVKIKAGDIEGAMESSRKANKWSWYSVVAAAIYGVIYLITKLNR
jgi:predicted secreted protein